jgi:hypothetical protein
MPTFGPIKRAELIHCLRKLGFEGPYGQRRNQVDDSESSSERHQS